MFHNLLGTFSNYIAHNFRNARHPCAIALDLGRLMLLMIEKYVTFTGMWGQRRYKVFYNSISI